jgi:hypothetical protein
VQLISMRCRHVTSPSPCALGVAAGLTISPHDKSAAASEAWTCFKVIKDKKFAIRYVVSGQILLHGDGSSHSKILINDDKLLISSATDNSGCSASKEQRTC